MESISIRTRLVLALFVTLPFFNFIGKFIDKSIPVGIISGVFLLIISVFSFQGRYRLSLNKYYYYYLLVLIIALYANYMYQIIAYEFNNLYYIGFFGLFIVLSFLFSLIENFSMIVQKYYRSMMLYFVVIISVSIYVDSLLIVLGLDTYQLMYDASLWSYVQRPFGIFGQPSVNSTLLICFYLLFLYLDEQEAKGMNKKLFLLVSLAIVLQGSGSGFLSYIVLLMAVLSKVRFFWFWFLVFVLLLLEIVASNVVYRISWNYLTLLMEYFEWAIIAPYLEMIKSPLDLLLGIDGYVNLLIDFGPLFLIAKLGLVYFCIYSLLIIYLFFKNKNVYHRSALCVLVLGSMHYPVMFYITMHFVLVFILYDTMQQSKKITNVLTIRRKIFL